MDAADPQTIQHAVQVWKTGIFGWLPTYDQALALINLRLNIATGHYADDRSPAEGES